MYLNSYKNDRTLHKKRRKVPQEKEVTKTRHVSHGTNSSITLSNPPRALMLVPCHAMP